MKKYILAIIVLVSCFACQPTEDEKAAPLMKKIEMLYHDGQYQAALNAITQLRARIRGLSRAVSGHWSSGKTQV